MAKWLLTVCLVLGVWARAQPEFEGTPESVGAHEVPGWFNDAKLGIFVHWGVYPRMVTSRVLNEGEDVPEANVR